jgi:hypothetical protein
MRPIRPSCAMLDDVLVCLTCETRFHSFQNLLAHCSDRIHYFYAPLSCEPCRRLFDNEEEQAKVGVLNHLGWMHALILFLARLPRSFEAYSKASHEGSHISQCPSPFSDYRISWEGVVCRSVKTGQTSSGVQDIPPAQGRKSPGYCHSRTTPNPRSRTQRRRCYYSTSQHHVYTRTLGWRT